VFDVLLNSGITKLATDQSSDVEDSVCKEMRQSMTIPAIVIINLLAWFDVSLFFGEPPISGSPSAVNATYDGGIRLP
jgi:hypothetical protein